MQPRMSPALDCNQVARGVKGYQVTKMRFELGKHMEIYGNTWKYMEIYGNIWKAGDLGKLYRPHYDLTIDDGR